jgi:hypothetical protein
MKQEFDGNATFYYSKLDDIRINVTACYGRSSNLCFVIKIVMCVRQDLQLVPTPRLAAK